MCRTQYCYPRVQRLEGCARESFPATFRVKIVLIATKHKPQPIRLRADSIYCAQLIPRLSALFIRTKMMTSLDFRTLALQVVLQQ